MTFTQQVHDCADHPDCTNILCVDDDTGLVVWESHDHNEVPAENRINPDHPAEDHRGPGDPVPIDPAPLDPAALPEWVQPTGAHDAYHLGDRVAHHDTGWASNIEANTWEPGVYGWDPLG
jgi:hypothetical protein